MDIRLITPRRPMADGRKSRSRSVQHTGPGGPRSCLGNSRCWIVITVAGIVHCVSPQPNLKRLPENSPPARTHKYLRVYSVRQKSGCLLMPMLIKTMQQVGDFRRNTLLQTSPYSFLTSLPTQNLMALASRCSASPAVIVHSENTSRSRPVSSCTAQLPWTSGPMRMNPGRAKMTDKRKGSASLTPSPSFPPMRGKCQPAAMEGWQGK
jgi:hypothetical protein